MGLLRDFYNGAMAIPSTPRPSSNANGRLNVSKGNYQVREQSSFELENKLRNVVANPTTRRKLAGRLWDSRGGSGITPSEVKSEIEQMRRRKEITDSQAAHFKNDLGAY